jgi:hypothetical protein
MGSKLSAMPEAYQTAWQRHVFSRWTLRQGMDDESIPVNLMPQHASGGMRNCLIFETGVRAESHLRDMILLQILIFMFFG